MSDDRGDEDEDRLARERERPGGEAHVPEARVAKALGAEEHQAEAGEREVHADRDDQEDEHGRVGEPLVGEAIDERPEQRDDGERERALREQVQLERRRPPGQRRDDDRRRQRAHEAANDRRRGQAAPDRVGEVEQRRQRRQPEQQPDRPRHLAELQQRERQRAVGDELALRDEDDPRDREHEHRRQRQQRVDGAVGDAVEEQDAGGGEVHVRGRSTPRGRRDGRGGARPDRAAWAAAKPAREPASIDDLPVAVRDLQQDTGLRRIAEVIGRASS